MPQVAVAAVAAGVSAGVGGLVAGATTSAIITSVIASAAMAAVTGAINMALTDSPSISPQPPNTLMKQPIPSGKIPYGRSRVGGDLCLMEAGQGVDDGKLHLGMLVACCRINGVLRIYDGDNLMWSDTQGLTDDYRDKIERIEVQLGRDDQAAIPDLVADLPNSLDNSFRLRGWAWVWIKLNNLADHWAAGLPSLWCEVEGAHVYDPRSATWGYSANWALCVADYLTRKRGGAGYDWSKLDEEALIVAANLCDERVPYRSKSGSYARYEVNGLLDTEVMPRRNLLSLMPYGLGKVIESNGLFRIYAGAYRAPLFALEPRHLLKGATMSGAVKHEELIDGVRGFFSNPEANYNEDDFGAILFSDFAKPVEQARWLDMDLGRERNQERAQGLAVLAGRQQRRLWKLSATVALTFMFVEAGDAAAVTLPRLGVDGAYEVIRSTLNLHPEQSTVSLELLENDPSFWDLGGEQFALAPTPAPSTLPNPNVVKPPSGVTITPTTEQLADGTRVPTLVVEWTASPTRSRRGYYVRWTRPDGSEAEQFTRATRFVIRGEVDPVSVAVIAVNHLGVPSEPADGGTVQPAGDSIPPSAPSAFSIIAGFERVGLFWTNPPEADLSAILIRESKTSAFGDSVLVGSVAGSPGAPGFGERPGLTDGEKRFYWITSKDRSGNVQPAWVGPVSATPTKIDTHQLAFDKIPQDLLTEFQLTLNNVEDGLLTGSKFAAHTVTGYNLAFNTVAASHVVIASLTNLVPDDQILDPNAWSSGNWTYHSASSIPWRSTGYWSIHPRDIPLGGNSSLYSAPFPVDPGDELYAEVQLHGGPANIGIFLRCYDRDGNYIDVPDGYGADMSVQTLRATTMHHVVPAGASTARIHVRCTRDGSVDIIRVGGHLVRRKAGGELIIDGSLTAQHIDVLSILADSAFINNLVVNKAQIGELAVGHGELDYGAAHIAFMLTDNATHELFSGDTFEVQAFDPPHDGFLTYKLQINFFGVVQPLEMRLKINGATVESWTLDPVNGTTGNRNAYWVANNLYVSDGLVSVPAGSHVAFVLQNISEALNVTFSRLRAIVQQKT